MKVSPRLVELEGIGQVLFEPSKRAKHLNISVRPFKGVRVAVPYAVSFVAAIKLAESKKRWIQKHLNITKQMEREQKTIANDFAMIDKTRAKEQLINRLEQLSKRYRIYYNKVCIRNQKTRWGSCSSKNNISLNIQIVRLPENLIDYILLHELTHVRVKNHSKLFWKELDRLVGNAKAMDKKLNEYKVLLL